MHIFINDAVLTIGIADHILEIMRFIAYLGSEKGIQFMLVRCAVIIFQFMSRAQLKVDAQRAF